MNIVLFGAPGAGKGTQSALLVEKLKFRQISTGDLLRSAIKNKTALGDKAQAFIDQGELVPDSIVIQMVDEALEGIKGTNFILDGFPRNVSQAEALGKILSRRKLEIGKAIFLEVPNEALLSRLTGRRVCKSCGAVYHVSLKKPKTHGVCDVCGGEVIQRNDDKEDVIAIRLKTYEESTAPLKEYYKGQGRFVQVDGNKETDLVFVAIEKEVRSY